MRSQIFIFFLLVLSLPSCGAPTKSAGEVSSLFSDENASSLQVKILNVCNGLDGRQEHPKLDGLTVKLDGCRNAGLSAVNYRKASKFHFVGLDQGQEQSDEVAIFDVRGQVWLNRSLLGMAGAVSNLLEEKKSSGGASDGVITVPDSGQGSVGGLATPTLTQTNAFLDSDKLAFGMDIDFKLAGVVDVDLPMQLRGQLIDDNSFAVTIRSLSEPPYEKSFIKSVDAVVIVVPHASDMYLDVFVQLQAYKIGLVDSAIKDQITTFLGTSVKQMIDTMMQL